MLMMIRIAILILASMVGVNAYAKCDPPEEVLVPDGANATEDDMTTGQDFIRKFMSANEDYRKCLDDEVAELGDEATEEAKASSTQLYNLSVDREETLVENFNTEVRAFNKANP